MKHIFLLLLMAVLMIGCHTEKKVADDKSAKKEPVVMEAPSSSNRNAASKVAVASPKAIIYKMKKDYSQKVPVILSEDKKSIVSYPHPRDVYTNGKLAVPTQLNDGYWLDNRGINENVAFLSYTYEEYAALTDAPEISTLYKKIVDKNPITEMWDCGRRHNFGDIVTDLNEVISNKDVENKFKRLK